MRIQHALATFALIVAGSVALHAAPLDYQLYTTYSVLSDGYVQWTTCGSVTESGGCFSSGGIGPFGRVGAMLEGNPATNLTKKTVTRYVYILDLGYGTGRATALYVYKKVDTITATDDAVTFTLERTLSLPLTGGNESVPSMAANGNSLFIGTNQDQTLVQVKKSSLLVATVIPGFGAPITSISANQYGYVAVTWGKNGALENGYYQYAPNGAFYGSGGGTPFLLSIKAFFPATIE